MLNTLFPIFVNLFSGAGAGKSTLAKRLVADLSIELPYSVELVGEYIKQYAYANQVPDKWHDPMLIFANQLNLEQQLTSAGVQVLVSDSPMGIQLAYMYRDKCEYVNEMFSIWLKYQNARSGNQINLMLKRSDKIPYKDLGRWETKDKAIEMDITIRDVLDTSMVKYEMVDPTEYQDIKSSLIVKIKSMMCGNE